MAAKIRIFLKAVLPLIFIVLISCSFDNKDKEASDSDSNKTVKDSIEIKDSVSAIKTNTSSVKKKSTLNALSVPGTEKKVASGAIKNKLADNKPSTSAKSKGGSGSVQSNLTLKEAYKNYFPIGAAVDNAPFLNNKAKAAFVASEYSSITPANQLKPTRIQPTEGVFKWAEADKAVNFAIQNNMKVRGHFLISPHNMPDWFFKDGFRTVSKEVLLKRMQTHITTVMQHFKGKVYCWDVVNEAVSKDQREIGLREKDQFYQIIGESYIDKAFEFARKADPTAKLFYNDNAFHIPSKRNKIYAFVKALKARNVQIDGIGMQSHMGINGISEKMFRENIDMFSKLGLDVQITELDVSIFPSTDNGWMTARAAAKFNDQYTDDVQAKQAAIYDMVFRVCRENKDKVTGITLWAPADWDNQFNRRTGKQGFHYLFDKNLQPKRALFSVLNFTK